MIDKHICAISVLVNLKHLHFMDLHDSNYQVGSSVFSRISTPSHASSHINDWNVVNLINILKTSQECETALCLFLFLTVCRFVFSCFGLFIFVFVFMSGYHSCQMSLGSQVSKVILGVQVLKWRSPPPQG